jgi:hypothetical protein
MIACSVQDDESALRQETAGSKQIAANDLVSCKYAVTICGELLERLQGNELGDDRRRQSIRQVPSALSIFSATHRVEATMSARSATARNCDGFLINPSTGRKAIGVWAADSAG